MKYPHLDYKKCYHAGDTRNHLNNNIQIAVKAGSVRIGHGLNIIQRIQFLPHCADVCFELNPISNLTFDYQQPLFSQGQAIQYPSAPMILANSDMKTVQLTSSHPQYPLIGLLSILNQWLCIRLIILFALQGKDSNCTKLLTSVGANGSKNFQEND